MNPVLVNYGGGVNSTAVLAGMIERGLRPDAIIFADTGGEKPETYAHGEVVSRWCESVGFPEITTVRVEGGKHATLEERCLADRHLPSIAYGFKSCSQRWKADPVRKWVNGWNAAREAWSRGEKVTQAFGYDAGEERRTGGKGSESDAKKYQRWFPLIEWGWFREECVEAIRRAGLKVPPKSSCFFCPSSKPSEVLALKQQHPGLFARAVAIEDAAKDTRPNGSSIVGLGRSWSWRKLGAQDEAQGRLPFGVNVEIPCGCYDGEPDEAAAAGREEKP